jgi:serine/threonine-protein kinase
MNEPTFPDDSRQRRLEEAMAEYMIAADAGRAPETESFLGRYPDLHAELTEFLADLSALAGLVEPLLLAAAPREHGDSTQTRTTVPINTDTTEGWPAATDAGATVEGPEQTDSAVAGSGMVSAPGSDTAPDPEATATLEPGSPESEPAVALPGGTRVRYFGDYELVRELGRGGMGIVYKARQISLNRPVALKMLQAGFLATEDDLRRFQNEAEAVAMLDHPHIVPVLEVGQHQAQRYFSMKLIGGPSLDRKVGEYTNDPKAAARLMRTVAEAVHHAHQRGILHRDLKPGNILLDDRGEPHVTDFGLAKRLQGDSELTQSGAILGTPAYMAPEQASGKRGMVTTASDIYGLGAILYALLTGRAPFCGDSPVETLEQVRERAPEPPSKRNPRVQRDLEIIVLKCLEKDPARRYSSAQALAEDLRRYLFGESITARSVGGPTRVWMWCKRNPALARLGLALVLVASIAVISGVAAVVIEHSRQREAASRKETRDNFNMAQKAVEEYLFSVSENTLLQEQDTVDLRNLRQELLQKGLTYYELFVKQRSDDPAVRRELAIAYRRIGAITQEIGSHSKAIEAYRTARSLWESLRVADPKEPDLAAGIAECDIAIGTLQSKNNNLQGAMESLTCARTTLEPLAASQPSQVRYQSSLVECYTQIGIVQSQLESGDQGLDALQSAQQVQQALIARSSPNPIYQKSLAEILNGLGFVYYKRHDLENALRSFRAVRDICQSLLNGLLTGPKPVRLISLLALSHFNIGAIELENGNLEEALKSYELSLAARSALAAAHPSVIEYQERLGGSYRDIAMVQHRAQQQAKAFSSIQNSIQVFESLLQRDSGQARFHSDLGLSCAVLGDFCGQGRENERAIRALERAVHEQKLAIQLSQNTDEYKRNLCLHLESLGEQNARLGRLSAAWPHFQQALDLRDGLCSAHPDNSAFAMELEKALLNLGTVQHHAGDMTAALKSITRALDPLEKSQGKIASRETTLSLRLATLATRKGAVLIDVGSPAEAETLLEGTIASVFPRLSAADARVEERECLSEAFWELRRARRALMKAAAADQADSRREALWKGRAPRELVALALKEAGRAALIGLGKTQITPQAQAVEQLDLEQASTNLRLAIFQGFNDLRMLRSQPESTDLLTRQDIAPLLMDLAFPVWPLAANR